ncbi:MULTISPECIES: hypothetical protein [unclassified Caulobacter]|uniref:hypothetical protein n=1 Tax=unclassified Caulobacter TaxID=2648921 RepID=UPI000D39463A|nr:MULTISPECIES: hypothetical protein [unclassified Caulobacter]PTS83248.1 hypothetical protein DBR21_16640 [Caulobacter sp. HMWF009]PTT12096.1 hypothetical protein DBR10_02285 [Caulobacter sp. HMWF025]
MNDPIHPVRRTAQSRRMLPALLSADSPAAEDEVVQVQEEPAATPPPPRRAAYATFAAHLMGQSGQKRGLRGGQEVLDSARSTYLGTEYSGQADRRTKTGRLNKTEI